MGKYDFEVREISKELALEMVRKYHYSNTLPKLNKCFCGFYLENKLVGMVTLGYGTRPLHTIKKLFNNLESKDYLEIGRMCMTDEMPKNSESQMLSKLTSFIKQKFPHLKILFTWADGMLGKCGYVYQASGFIYCGYSMTDTYIMNGKKIHPRQTKALLSPNDKRITVRPTLEQMKKHNIYHYKGKQFKYFKFICSKREKKKLIKECLVPLDLPFPKEKDLMWLVKDESGKWIDSPMPNYQSDLNHEEVLNVLNKQKEYEQTSIFDYIDEQILENT